MPGPVRKLDDKSRLLVTSVQAAPRARDKLIRLYDEGVSLKEEQVEARADPGGEGRGIRRILRRLFNIAHQDALTLLTEEEDRSFLLAQREDEPRGSLGSRDMSLAVKEKKVKEKLESTNPRRAEAEAKVCLELDRSVVAFGQFFRLQCQSRQQSYPALRAHTKGNVFNDGDDEGALNARSDEFREEAAKEIKAAFNPDAVLIVHWDGKIVPESDGGEGASTGSRSWCRGASGSSSSPSQAPVRPSTGLRSGRLTALEDWELEERVRGLSFDTTAVTAGWAFSTCLGVSNGPDIQLFKRFQGGWEFIDRTTPEPFTADDVPERDELLVNFRRFLDHAQPRADYRELLELCVIALGGVPKRGIASPAPDRSTGPGGGKGHLRCEGLPLQGAVLADGSRGPGHQALCAVRVRTYAAAWFRTPLATAAPALDLAFVNALRATPTRSCRRRQSGLRPPPVVLERAAGGSGTLRPRDLPLGVKRDMVQRP
ncbi:hypothetical protein GWK47_053035 [Chionoecetes opilio]|uniref:Uncharacterized protein n=1 Tax=Chionoecetes opilio TaxID=41210 RepID=A0A8J4XZH4_CHIOP|nr:hypothetical protein GWK47_053035 [Chionoecetes opilio]